MGFIAEIAPRTKSLLLATATPVQLYPIEAFDLLSLLSIGNDHVLGNDFSRWRYNRKSLFQWVMGKNEPQLERRNARGILKESVSPSNRG